MKIFGYGSLIEAEGINGRRMRRWYTNKDLTEVSVKGYIRGWTGHYFQTAYLGLSPSSKEDKVNGVVFDVSEDDLPYFLASEGFYSECPPYTLEKIKVPGFKNVYTCMVNKPSFQSGGVYIPVPYLDKIQTFLKRKSRIFQKEFHEGTIHNAQAKRFFGI